MSRAVLICLCAGPLLGAVAELEGARDRQDRAALEQMLSKLEHGPEHYRAAIAASYLAEVALELRDKDQARQAAERGVKAAERAIVQKPESAEYHRVLGTLCGQVVPAHPLSAFTYGKRARDEIEKAIQLDPKSAQAYLARGIGNYYLPGALGGGPERAIVDFRKATELDPKDAEAYLWLGLALRKVHQNAEARKAFAKSLQLNPNRVWTRIQLEKTAVQ